MSVRIYSVHFAGLQCAHCRRALRVGEQIIYADFGHGLEPVHLEPCPAATAQQEALTAAAETEGSGT